MDIAHHVISKLQNLIFVKDLSHRYIFCNERFAQVCGEDSPEACYGKTDEMLIWNKCADLYREGDIKVFQGQTLCNMLEPVPQPTVDVTMLVNKQPFFNKEGKISGVVCASVDVTGLLMLTKTPQTTSKAQDSDLGDYFGNAILSSRELQVLKGMLTGKTAKEIATILSLSPKSIESYTSRLKVKMQCRTRGDILYHAVLSGLYLRLFPTGPAPRSSIYQNLI